MADGGRSAGLRRLVNLAVEDPRFRKALAANPEKALSDYNVRANKKVLKALKGLDYGALQKLSKAFGHTTRGAAN